MAEKLSELEHGIELTREQFRDQRTRRKIQKRELRKITTFFIAANIVIALIILLFGLLEHFQDLFRPKIITEKVIIAAIGGVTLQAGAIILAAFKGLFSES